MGRGIEPSIEVVRGVSRLEDRETKKVFVRSIALGSHGHQAEISKG